jgi:hypothetical protein
MTPIKAENTLTMPQESFAVDLAMVRQQCPGASEHYHPYSGMSIPEQYHTQLLPTHNLPNRLKNRFHGFLDILQAANLS